MENSADNGRFVASKRLKLRTLAINKLCTRILDRPRRQARPKPCHCLASANTPSITGARAL